MEQYVSFGLLIVAPIATLAFVIEYGWSDWLEARKPKTGSMGQPLGTTPVGYMRDQERIDKEAPILEQFKKDMQKFEIHRRHFDRMRPYIKKIRLYSGILTFLLGCIKLSLLGKV
jgi:hypothetical protein